MFSGVLKVLVPLMLKKAEQWGIPDIPVMNMRLAIPVKFSRCFVNGRQEGVLKRLLVVVGTLLWIDGCLEYFLAAVFLLSPLDKVTVSVVNFLEPFELLENLVKGILAGK